MKTATLSACLSLLVLAGCGSKQAETAGNAGDSHDLSGVWQIAKKTDVLLTADGKTPPLLPEAKQIYDQRLAAKAKGDLSSDPAQSCKPLGEPRAMLEMGWPFEIAQSDERIDILYQWNRLDHVIPIRPDHPPLQGPFYFGESIGAWESNTLVVDVVNMRPESWLDPSGLPRSDQMHMVERFSLINGGKTLEVRLHIEDPGVYAAPWDAVLNFDKKTDLRIPEDVCLERINLQDKYWSLNNALKK